MKKLVPILVILMLVLSVSLTAAVPVQAALTYDQKQQRAADRKYVNWTKGVTNKITNATPGKKITISTEIYTSFPSYVIEALDKRPDVTLVVNWVSNGQNLSFTIPAGTDVMKVLDQNGFAGFMYLQGLFGPKGNTAAAKQLKTKSTTPPVGAGISDKDRNLAIQLKQQAVELYLSAGMSPEEAQTAATEALPSLLKKAGVADSVILAITSEAVNSSTPTTNSDTIIETDAQIIAQQLAQQAYAQFISAGMNSEDAFAATQQVLPSLLQQAGIL